MNKSLYWLLFLSAAVAIILRAKLAATLPIWIDEAIVFNLAHNTPYSDLIVGNYWDASHPPLLHLITKILTLFISEKNLLFFRLLHSVIFALAVFPLGAAIKKISGSNISAFLGTLLIATHPLILANTFSVRPYSLLIFFVSAFLVTEFRARKTKYTYLFQNLLLVSLFHTTYAAIWFILPFFVYKLLKNKNFIFLKHYIPAAVASSFWILNLFLNVGEISQLNLYAQNYTFQFFAQQVIGVSYVLLGSSLKMKGTYFLFIFANVLVLAYSLLKLKTKKRYLLLYILIPLLFLISYSVFSQPVYIYRQFITITIFLHILYSLRVKNKLVTILITLIITINFTQSLLLKPSFRYLAVSDFEQVTSQNSMVIYPYYNLDVIDYLLRNEKYARMPDTYNPVIYNDNSKFVLAVSKSFDIDTKIKLDKLILIHPEDANNADFLDKVSSYCAINLASEIQTLADESFKIIKCKK